MVNNFTKRTLPPLISTNVVFFSLSIIKAIMEECELTLSETKKESYEFERDILKGAINQRTGKVIAEKVSRYFEDKIKSRVR